VTFLFVGHLPNYTLASRGNGTQFPDFVFSFSTLRLVIQAHSGPGTCQTLIKSLSLKLI